MLKIKAGGRPDLLLLLAALANTAEQWWLTITVTAGSNGTHMPGSRHDTYQAIDVRSTAFRNRDDKRLFLRQVIERLGPAEPVTTSTGPGYQTVDGRWLGILEYEGKANEHFHLERN